MGSERLKGLGLSQADTIITVFYLLLQICQNQSPYFGLIDNNIKHFEKETPVKLSKFTQNGHG